MKPITGPVLADPWIFLRQFSLFFIFPFLFFFLKKKNNYVCSIFFKKTILHVKKIKKMKLKKTGLKYNFFIKSEVNIGWFAKLLLAPKPVWKGANLTWLQAKLRLHWCPTWLTRRQYWFLWRQLRFEKNHVSLQGAQTHLIDSNI